MKKKTVFTILQIVVTVGILVWIFHDPKKRADMWDAVRHANLRGWILAGIAAYGVVELLGATRWQILLRVQGIDIPWFRLVKLLMIGIFFNQLMPGGTGGDVVKIFYLLKETPNKKPEAVLAVLMDRLVGLIGLIFVAGVVIIWNWSWLTRGQSIPHFEFSWLFSYSQHEALAGADSHHHAIALHLAGDSRHRSYGLLIVSFIITGFGLAHKLPAKFPKRDVLIDLTVAYNMYAKAWKASLLAIFLSFGVHICSFLMFYAGAQVDPRQGAAARVLRDHADRQYPHFAAHQRRRGWHARRLVCDNPARTYQCDCGGCDGAFAARLLHHVVLGSLRQHRLLVLPAFRARKAQ